MKIEMTPNKVEVDSCFIRGTVGLHTAIPVYDSNGDRKPTDKEFSIQFTRNQAEKVIEKLTAAIKEAS